MEAVISPGPAEGPGPPPAGGKELSPVKLAISIPSSYPTMAGARKLLRDLGAEGVKSHLFLICKVAQCRPDGVLEGFEWEDIEEMAEWKGKAGEFVDTLLKRSVGLMENKHGSFRMKDWDMWCPGSASLEKRRERARRAAKARWSRPKRRTSRESRLEPKTKTKTKKRARPRPATEGKSMKKTRPETTEEKATKEAKVAQVKPEPSRQKPEKPKKPRELVIADEPLAAPANIEAEATTSAPQKRGGGTAELVLSGWNKLAKQKGMRTARRLNPGRKNRILNRLKDRGWDWQAAINHLDKALPDLSLTESGKAKRTFLQGGGPAYKENGDPWVADFDFFIRTNSVDRILEGKYDPAAGLARSSGPADRRNQEMMKEHESGSDWASRKEEALRGEPTGDR